MNDPALPEPVKTENEEAAQPYGPYLLLEKIGSGGMAEVFRAVRGGPEGFMRLFAVKRIIPRHAESREFLEMFCNEARLSALLNHPNLVQVYDFGEVEGSYYLAMEYLAGKTALNVMRSLHARKRPFPVGAVAYIGRQVALGLAYAHSIRGGDGLPLHLVHRDINPSNIMLQKSGAVKVLDFGIAKAPVLAKSQTQAGLVKGKLSYASPEQLKCKPLDGRSDVFSLGVMLWEMLTMRKLFGGATDFDTVSNVMQRAVRPSAAVRSDVPEALDAILLQMLERDPKKRLDAKQVGASLGEFLRENRYSEDSLVELLRELFGEHTSRVLTLAGQGPEGGRFTPPQPQAAARPSSPMAALPTGSAGGAGVAATGSPSTARATGPGVVAKVAEKLRNGPWPRLAVAVLGVALVAFVVWGSFSRMGVVLTDNPPGARISAEQVGGQGQVSLELDSRPSGAMVEAADGALVGQTPLVIRLPASEKPTSLVLRKAGYEPLVYEVVAKRDAMATLELVPAKP